MVLDRSRGGGCPYCAGKRPIQGVNDLATLRPDLAAQWHASNDLRPNQVLPMSGRKVAWQCARGHVWETFVFTRSRGIGCPYCSGRLPVTGETDLATVRPDLVEEWDPSNSHSPLEVTAHCDRRATWKCRHGHIWEATIKSRTAPRGTGCPCCSGRSGSSRRSR